ncbi:ATP-binding protein [Mesorhizobium sp. M0387]|uniref:ATP-binding protein n=1 Tax=Mesorhizobium sp. M0387 TaxID=2956940 RepID=UPI00333572A6
MGKVIYLTGAPASGKSSTARLLADAIPGLLVWEYGARLTDHVRSRSAKVSSQDNLREHSSAVVTPEDVAQVDLALLDFVAANRASKNIIIDSRPVTKERYGFRITPFSLEQFNQLDPDEIWLLYASPEVTIARIEKDAAGRPMISEEEARMHTALQSSVAATYGMSAGAAIYLFDTSAPDRASLISLLGRRLT